MNSTKYQDIIRSLPCSFCRLSGWQMVSWHHLKILGISGAGKKTPDWMTCSTCNSCHSAESKSPSCHNGGKSKEEQIDAMIDTWNMVYLRGYITDYKWREFWKNKMDIERENIGERGRWQKIGEAYKEALGWK